MPVPAYDMFTWSGEFGEVGAPTEIWSTSLKVTPFESLGDEATNAFTGMTAWQTWINPLFQATVRLTRTRYSRHAAGGLVERGPDGGYVQADDLTVVGGGVSPGTTLKPIQTALCVSLGTARPGPTGRGRMFLPFPNVVLDNSYRINPAAVTDLCEAFDGFLSSGLTLFEPVVVSSMGFRSTVTNFRIGRVPDTMRSRRNALSEEYQTVALS